MNEEKQDNLDLPEDCSSVLLLGVTRIPTSPVPVRRPCSLPLDTVIDQRKTSSAQARRSSFTSRRHIARSNSSSSRSSSKRKEKNSQKWQTGEEYSIEDQTKVANGLAGAVIATASTGTNTPSAITTVVTTATSTIATMDRSVDSIGTCSLDVEASAELSDWSEASSGGTLRSASLKSPSNEQHLPSYLSLACTVNGYSTTTNYDPERLARSRDVSPHRTQHDNLITPRNTPSYSIQNNLLSPPNLVPLPSIIKSPKMNDSNTRSSTTTQEYYRSTKSITFITTKETHSQSFNGSTMYTNSKDTVDACYENGHSKSNLSHHGTKNYTNGQSELNNTTTETTIKEFTNGTETKTKSIVQQRIERLYGPGALAQTFFAIKKQSNTFSSDINKKNDQQQHQQQDDNNKENISNRDKGIMKQSASNPTLPVLRHLRAEFRAQLPISNTRKSTEGSMQKSSTVPALKDEVKNNGHHQKQMQTTLSEGADLANSVIAEESGEKEKDGHYFLKILQRETERLLREADRIEEELKNYPDLSEEIVGKIMSAAGKARLLVSQKMQQFKGLCTNNITQAEGEQFPTTNEDLQGFWDMVMLQVDQVDALFKEIMELKANNWCEVPVVKKQSNTSNGSTKVKKVISRPKVQTAASIEARKQREAERKQLIDARRKEMKERAASKPNENIEIFVPESS